MKYTIEYIKFLDEAEKYFEENKDETIYKCSDDYRVAIRDIEKDTVVTYEFIEGIHGFMQEIKNKKWGN